MSNKENQSQRFIYIRATKEKVPVSDEVFKDFYDEAGRIRKREQYHKRCMCPKKYIWACDGDCAICEYHAAGDTLSLDYIMSADAGNEKSWLDNMSGLNQDVQSILEDQELLQALYNKLEELDPNGRTICELIMQGQSEREAAATLQLARSTFKRQWAKIKDELYNALKKYC